MIRETIAGDDRFVLHEHESRIGSFANFERALRLVGDSTTLVAFADQDDRWYPDKLLSLRAALSDGALLAYSDARVVDEAGKVLSPTYWSVRRNNFTDISALLVANTVTGAASLFRRQLLDTALPFPALGPEAHHDHWVALVALALGRIQYVDRPLYDYVQHGGALLGHGVANTASAEPRAVGKLRALIGDLAGPAAEERRRRRMRRWRLDYPFLVATQESAKMLLLRCGNRVAASKRRRLQRFLTLGRPFRGLLWLSWRTLRAVEDGPTLARERRLLRGKLSVTATRSAARLRRAPDPPPRG